MKKIISILLFALLSLQVFPYEWEIYGPPGADAFKIHFFKQDFCSAIFTENGFFLTEQLNAPSWEFYEFPANGAAAYNEDTILVIRNTGSYSDGIYFMDVNTHEYSVAEHCYKPNCILKAEWGDHYFVGFEGGMYESMDGHTWTEVSAFTGVKCLDIACGQPDVVAVACNYLYDNVFISYDDGVTWTQIINEYRFFELAFKGYYGMLNNLVGICEGNLGGLYELNGDVWEVLYYDPDINALGLDNSQTPYIGWHQGTQPHVGIGRFKMNPPNAGLSFFNEGLPDLNIIDIGKSPPIFGSNWVFCCTESGAYVCKGISIGVESLYIQGSDIKIYPNPVMDVLNISMEGEGVINAELVFMNSRGREVMREKLTFACTAIDISSLPASIYFLAVYDDSGVLLQSERIVKQ